MLVEEGLKAAAAAAAGTKLIFPTSARRAEPFLELQSRYLLLRSTTTTGEVSKSLLLGSSSKNALYVCM